MNEKERGTVTVVRKLFKGRGNWNTPTEENVRRFLELFRELDRIFGVRTQVRIELNPTLYSLTGGGCCNPETGEIHLFRLSLMTALHEWAHRLGMGEEDAVRWSHRIFEEAFPLLYRRNVEQGRFFHRPIEGGEP